MSKKDITKLKTWECKIGEHEALLLPPEADAPMRKAVAGAYRTVTGAEPDYIFSGWGAELTEGERAAYENRTPSEEYYKEWLAREAATALLGALECLYAACNTPWRRQSRDEIAHTLCDAEAERFRAEWEQVMIDAEAALKLARGEGGTNEMP